MNHVSASLGSFILTSPVLTASGCGGTGRELDAIGGMQGLGGFVTRSISLDAREGNPAPRVAESPAGLVNAVGLQNPGIDQFLARELPWLAAHAVPAIVSIVGASIGEYADLGRRLGRSPGVAAIEVNLSVPDGPELGIFDAREPFSAARVVAAVRRDLPRGTPVLAKLGPEVSRLGEMARAVAEAGADAVVVTNALPSLMPNGRTGGLSGPAIGPLALRCVREVRAAIPDLAIIGVGGISCTADLRSFLAAGATAVQVGTALLHDPTTAARMAAQINGEIP